MTDQNKHQGFSSGLFVFDCLKYVQFFIAYDIQIGFCNYVCSFIRQFCVQLIPVQNTQPIRAGKGLLIDV